MLYIVDFIQSSQGLQHSVFCLQYTGEGKQAQRGFVSLQVYTQLLVEEFEEAGAESESA